MKKLIILILLFGQNLVAQTTFFVAPLAITKVYLIGDNIDQRFGFNIEFDNFSHSNPYYTFRAKKVSTRPELLLGIRFGATFKNKKHLLSLELAPDASGTMRKNSYFLTSNLDGSNATPQYNTYGNGVGYFQTAFAYNRFSINYGIRLTKESRPTKVYFLSDFSIIYGKSNTFSYTYDSVPNSTSVYYHNNAKFVSEEIYSIYWGNTSWMIGLGLKADIGITFKNKARYLFSVETSFRQGFRNIISTVFTTVISDNNQKVAFINDLGSRGSGIYFLISRNFQIFPWRPNKKL